jgi:hypothetical protein
VKYSFAVCALLAASRAVGQTPYPYGTPEATAEAVLSADSLHDWHLLLALAHPSALEQHKREQLRMLRMENFPGFPDAISRCMASQMQQWHRLMLDSVYFVPTIDSLGHLAADSVFARDQRFFGRHAHVRARADSTDPSRRILGHVMADDSTAYVVLEYRYSHRPFPDWPLQRAEIMTLRRYKGSWLSMLDPNLGDGASGIMMDGEPCE